MLLDDLREQLKHVAPDVDLIKEFWHHSGSQQEFEYLTEQSNHVDFWQRTDQTPILKKLQRMKELRDQYLYTTSAYTDLLELLDMYADDPQEVEKIASEVQALVRAVKQLKLDILLRDEQDHSSCFVSVNAGAGGTESQDWAQMLLRMYVRFCERERMRADLIDYQAGEGAGIKSATLFVQGKNAYGLLKGEQGVHRLVRISPFDANKRRHTSFAAVSVTPEVPQVAITIDPKDLRIDTYRAGGAGGQHVNKTESAVRITHLPSGLVVQCQNERSQVQNKETAMKLLMAKLVQKQKEEAAAKAAAIEKQKIEWGSQIRSYVLHPYKLVKDHRTDVESGQPDLVLDGTLNQFIEAFLVQQAIQSASQHSSSSSSSPSS